jgi:hypothetical protein
VLGWYRDGLDVDAQMPRLSTYLGHADPAGTYWPSRSIQRKNNASRYLNSSEPS